MGTIFNNAKKAIEELNNEGKNIGLYNMRFLKPLDTQMLNFICEKYNNIITIEDGVLQGGFGWSVENYLRTNSKQNKVVCLGIEDKFIEHGSIEELQKICGIDIEGIKNIVKAVHK